MRLHDKKFRLILLNFGLRRQFPGRLNRNQNGTRKRDGVNLTSPPRMRLRVSQTHRPQACWIADSIQSSAAVAAGRTKVQTSVTTSGTLALPDTTRPLACSTIVSMSE